MMLSEKASAFFIENLIAKSEKKPRLNNNSGDQYSICSSSSNSSFSSSDYVKASQSPVPTHDCVSPISIVSEEKSNKNGLGFKKSLKSNYEYHISETIKSLSSDSSPSCSQLSPNSSSPHLYSPNSGNDSLNSSCKEQVSNFNKRKNLPDSESNKIEKSDEEDELPKTRIVKTNQSQLEDSEPNSITKAKTEICNGDQELNEIECFLETDDLWKKFHELGTEMIITKSGRRMFPPLRVSFGRAKLNQKYIIAMDIVPTDSKRYRYAYHRSSWLVAGKADPPVQSRLFVHPDGPFTGDTLYKQIVSFEKVKLTNNEMDKCGHIVLNSMHKYQPRVHIIKRPDDNKMTLNLNGSKLQTSSDLEGFEYKTFIFPETSFIAVTAYQNQLITKLKIDSNPFAKGFRDSSRLSDLERESIEQLIKENSSSNPNYSHHQNINQATNNFNPNSEYQNSYASINTTNQIKMFSEVPSMASILAAAVAAASKPNNLTNPNLLNFHLNSAQQQHSQISPAFLQSLHPDQAAALAAAYKLNSLYSPQQLVQQQNFSASLVKCMSLYYNKPAEYIQRVLAEQQHNSQVLNEFANVGQSFLSHSGSSGTPIINQQSNLLNNIGQRSNNLRFHPYMKNSQSSNVLVNTNSSVTSPALSVFSPRLIQNNRGKFSRSPSPACSIPSPAQNNANLPHRPSPVQTPNSNSSEIKNSISSVDLLSPKEKLNQKN